MKKSIYTFVTVFLILSVLSCSDSVQTDNVGRITEPMLEEDEKIEQTISVDYRGEVAELVFSNAVRFSIRPEKNPNAANEKISIALLENDRFFNTDNDIVFDFIMINNPFIIDLEYTLPTGLDEEDIVVLLYSPETSVDEFDHHEVLFEYNAEDGKLTASFSAPDRNPFTGKSDSRELAYKSGSSNYSRLNLSWSMRKDLLTEGPRRKIIKMPFYEQSHNTCWAASVKMMGRAYAPLNNREMELRLHEVVKHMNHSNFDGGAGLYAFRSTIPKYLSSKTNINFETSSFLRTSALQYEIVKKLNENKPVILNLRFPFVEGGHQIVVVGYEIDMVTAAKSTFKLLFHNPQNASVPGAGRQSMYTWGDFEWLMKDKWPQDLYQILYADRPIPNDRPLQTIVTPIFDKPASSLGTSVGNSELAIVIERLRPSTGQIVDHHIDMVYNRQKTDGYSWMLRNVPDDIELDVIPDSVHAIKLVQPVFNADDVYANLTLLVEAYDLNEGERLYNERTHKRVGPGTDRFNMRIPLDDFFDPEEEREITVYVQLLKDDHLFLDGYRFKFILEPKASYLMDVSFRIEGTRMITSWNAFGEEIISRAEPVTGEFKGELSFKEGSYSGGETWEDTEVLDDITIKWWTERLASARFNNDNNPTNIRKLEVTSNWKRQDESNDGESLIIESSEDKFIMENILITNDDIRKNEIVIWRTGYDVCDYFDSITSTFKAEWFYSDKLMESTNSVLTDYHCTEDSELIIRLKSSNQ